MTEIGVRRQAKTMRLGNDEQLDSGVCLWFRQKREEGVPTTGKHTIIKLASSSYSKFS